MSVLFRVTAVLASAAVLVDAATAAAPNVLVIVTDDQRAAGTMWVMPKTQRYFQRGGVEYPNGFAVTPLCCPSRATILTGRYAHNTGVHGNGTVSNLETTTMFPRLLQEDGYQTALVGKFLNSWPLKVAPPYFDKWAVGGAYVDPTFNVNGSIVNRSGYVTTLERAYALRFLRAFEANDDAPWFLYIAPRAPHFPWTPEPRYAGAQFPQWHGNPAVFERDRTDKPPFFQDTRYFTIDQGRRVREGQLRSLMSVDDFVGRVFSTLGTLGERRRTVAFFLSDNGYLWTDHHLGGDRGTAGQKRLPYTASIRVPFLVRWPGHLPAGARHPRLTGTVDIAPTILEAAGIPPDPAKPPLDGRSLLDPDARSRILLEYWHENDSPWIPTWASIRTKRFQYIEYYEAGKRIFREYYDLVHDPWQLGNVLHDGDPTNNPDVAALSAQLAQDRACGGTGSGPTPCP
jgi:arylsulfatase A-like enzyme